MKFEQLIQLIDHVSDSKLTSFQYETEDTKISMKRGQNVKAVVNGVPVNTADERDAELISEAFQGMASVGETGNVFPVNREENLSEWQSVKAQPQGNIITSPLVGTFYAAPAEDAPAFVKVGDAVSRGSIVAIVEAMKLMNEIESDFDGKVAEIYVQNGESVEYGQPLMRIE